MKPNGGFTLIELILVTVIIAILASMVVVNFGGRVQETQIRAAKGDIANYSTAIDLFRLDNNDQLPKTLNELKDNPQKRVYVKQIQPDPWKNPYNYKVTGTEYEIFSSGPDGTPNTEDDVTSTSDEKPAAE